jgi:hypothetical protein
VQALRHEAWLKCQQDGVFFLQFVLTRDEADAEAPVKLMPIQAKPYIRKIWTLLDAHQRVALVKSRQMMVSWILCAYAVWWARFKPHQLVLWQTQKKEDAIEKVSAPGSSKGGGGFTGRCQFIEYHLPPWLQIVDLKTSEGEIQYPNGSRILALPGGSDKVRGLTASLILEDEFAFQPEARGVYTAVAPLIQKGTKLVAVSTPNGLGNMFADLWFGRDTATEAAVSVQQ